jgi:multidrug efflux pump subunit AcrA (membrane-fusion protein)
MSPAIIPVAASQKAATHSWARKMALVGLLALLLFAGIWPRLQRSQTAIQIAHAAETSLPAVMVASATTAPDTSELVLPGSTEALHVATVLARASGYVGQRFVDIGSKVTAGQTLAVIESPELDQELEQARATLAQAKMAIEQAKANLEQAKAGVNQAHANVAQAKANEEIAETTDQRWSQLVMKGVLPKQSGDERRSAYLARRAETEAALAALRTVEATVTSRTADLNATEANVSAQEANVRRLERMQSFERVVAPFEGIVTERKIERGDLITAGGASLFTVAQANVLRIQVNVPQSHAIDLRPGQTAEVTVRELPGRAFHGAIARTANALNSSSRTLLAEVQIDNSAGTLLPGMYAQVKFSVPRGHPLVMIPAAALVANADGTRVEVLGNDGRVHFRSVSVGRDMGPQVEILSGLTEGEPVISNPPDTLADGQQVRVVKPAHAESKS